MPERLNVYLPDELHRALQRHRDVLNVSRVCQDALAREVARLETVQQDEGPLPMLDEDARAAVLERLRTDRDRRQTYWHGVGYRLAFEWAARESTVDALRPLAKGEALDADPGPGWVQGMIHSGSRPHKVMAEAYATLYARGAAVAHQRAGAPEEDLTAFNRGVRDGAKAVWDGVAAALQAEAEAEGDDEDAALGHETWSGAAPSPRPKSPT